MTGERVGRVMVGGWLGVVLGLGVAQGAAARENDPSRSIVKLYVTTVARDLFGPWRAGSSFAATGSGAVIEGRRILTAGNVMVEAPRKSGGKRPF